MSILRTLSALLCALLIGVPGPGVAAPADSALIQLCRAWNAVRFFHPGLVSEADRRWDQAGVRAAAEVVRECSRQRP